MATMRREPTVLLVAALSGLLTSAHGQELDIRPALDINATATNNASGSTEAPRKDVVITTSPEISISHAGAHASLEGRLRVDNVHFSRNSQPDRSLPSGDLIFRSDVIERWVGLDASLQSQQTAPNLLIQEPRFAETYTTTRAGLAPYVHHAFDNDTQLNARLERYVITSSSSEQLPDRPNAYLSRQMVRLERQPVPVGASLEWTSEDTQSTGQTDPGFKNKAARAGMSYAINGEWHTGLILGRGTYDLQGSQNETIRGLTLFWRPNERITLDSKVERRLFGTGWKVDWNHRTPFFAFNLMSERDATTYASSLGTLGAGQSLRELLDRMLTTHNQDPQSRNDLVDKTIAQRGLVDGLSLFQDPYSTLPTLRQTFQGRIVMMGTRNTVSLGGGMDKTSPLNLGNGTLNNDNTLLRFADIEFNRRLTSMTSLGTGVRWSMTSGQTSSTLLANGLTSGRVRTLTWHGDINTRLSQNATATFGLRRQNSHAEGNQLTVNGNDESAMYVGLGYRY